MLFTLHHAISPFSELYNNNLLYLLWNLKLGIKRCTQSLSSQSVVGKFTPSWYGLTSMRTSNREKPLAHKLCNFTSSLCTCPASSVSIVHIFSAYHLVWSNIRNSLYAKTAQKLIKIYRFSRAEENNQWNLLKLFELFLTFFQVLENFVADRFVSLKKITVNCTSELLVLIFISWYIFQRKRKEWDIWWVLLYVLSGL